MTPRERARGLFRVGRGRGCWVVFDMRGIEPVNPIMMSDSFTTRTFPTEAAAVAWISDYAAPIADAIERAIESALAEQAAGEAERVREAVAREREACAQACESWTDVYPGASYARGCAARIRARATSAPAAAPVASAERAVIEAAEAWRASLDGPGECWHEARMREAVDVLAAARKGGERG